MMLKKITYSELGMTPIVVGDIIYVTDRYDYYYDTAKGRSLVLDIVKIETEKERTSLTYIQSDKLYLVKEDNKLYRYLPESALWQAVDILEVVDLLTLSSELVPITIVRDGINYAPRTLANNVFTDDGKKLSDVMKDYVRDGKRFVLKTHTSSFTVTEDKQRVFTLDPPYNNFDFAKYPLHILVNGRLANEAYYYINGNQLIFSNDLSTGIKRGDKIIQVYHYVDIICETDGIDAQSINGVGFTISPYPPIRKEKDDIWIDTTEHVIKQYDGEHWHVAVSANGENRINFNVKKATMDVTEFTTTVDIGISTFNKDTDLLMVFLNSIYLEEGDDYTISPDSKKIVYAGDEAGWDGTDASQVFNFIVFKNVSDVTGDIDGSYLVDNTVGYDKLSFQVQNYIKDTKEIKERLDTIETYLSFCLIIEPLIDSNNDVLLTSDTNESILIGEKDIFNQG